MINDKILEVKELSYKIEAKNILSKISFTIEAGEWICLAGHNGSGKSILLQNIVGLHKPSSGDIIFRGNSSARNIHMLRSKVGFLFQNPDDQIIGQTVRQDIIFGLENLGLPRAVIEERLLRSLQKFRLEKLADARPYTLSGGEKKRLCLAALMVLEPVLLLLDEPFTGLDYHSISAILRILVDLHKKGTAILLSSHHLELMLAHCDTLLLLKNGHLLAKGRPEEVLASCHAAGVRQPQKLLRACSWLN